MTLDKGVQVKWGSESIDQRQDRIASLADQKVEKMCRLKTENNSALL